MKTFILIDRDVAALKPLTNHKSVAMLPVGNKPLVQITLEEAYGADIRQATVLHTDESLDAVRFLGDGSRWGMVLEHVSVGTRNADTKTWLSQLGSDVEPFVLLRADMLRPFGVFEEALKRHESQQLADIYTALGITFGPAEGALQKALWSEIEATCRLAPCALTSLGMYHSANMMALEGLVPGLRLAGRPAPDQLQIGLESTVKSRRAPGGLVAVGKHAFVADNVQLGPHAVIGDNCYIDRGAVITNSVVMPGTYVGRGITLNQAVAGQGWMFDVHTQEVLSFEDNRILSKAA
jgi:NDP-sugar pyrophosphorylase family protein